MSTFSAFDRTIYLDMDGVVADFNSYVGDLLGREIGWEGRDLSDEEWRTVSKHERLYFKLPIIQASKELVLTAILTGLPVKFLTAIPRRTSVPTAEQDKKEWAQIYFPGIKVEVGPHSIDKQRWAKWLDILVDDKKTNVEEWENAGGIAVHHTGNFSTTIENLKKAITITKPTILT